MVIVTLFMLHDSIQTGHTDSMKNDSDFHTLHYACLFAISVSDFVCQMPPAACKKMDHFKRNAHFSHLESSFFSGKTSLLAVPLTIN